ncbi:nucleotidyltransferase domain-containing protein [Candidatus Bathyarchaeota archaeon]|nr:nucleotidyltransferase domain-containing protein [Candidatus Bathyarchaeota archaeon]
MESRIPREYSSLIGEYCSAIKKHFGEDLVSICVFGSLARGSPKPSSDIDVMVVARNLSHDAGERTRSTNYIHQMLKSGVSGALRKLNRSTLISDIFLTPEEIEMHPPILLDMVEDSVILYDRMGFLKSTLNKIRDRLKEMGARKVSAKKGYFWILKPDAKPNEVVEV